MPEAGRVISMPEAGRVISMPGATISEVVARALAEDVGEGDVTTVATVPEQARARALITQKAPGVIYGLDVAADVFRALDAGILIAPLAAEGEWRGSGAVLRLEGP